MQKISALLDSTGTEACPLLSPSLSPPPLLPLSAHGPRVPASGAPRISARWLRLLEKINWFEHEGRCWGSHRRFSTSPTLTGQVAVAHRRVLVGFRSAASGYVNIWQRPRPSSLASVRGRRGVRFLPLTSCRHRDRLGHSVLANFLHAVAEARSPQRLREENVVRDSSHVLEPGDTYTSICIQLYESELRLQPISRRGPTEFFRRVASINCSQIGESYQHCCRVYEFSGHASSVPELGEITTVISHRHVLLLPLIASASSIWHGHPSGIIRGVDVMRGKGCTRMHPSCSCSF